MNLLHRIQKGTTRRGRTRRSAPAPRRAPLSVEALEDRRVLEGVPLITEFMAQNLSTLDSELHTNFRLGGSGPLRSN